jgi:hypothetical protein
VLTYPTLGPQKPKLVLLMFGSSDTPSVERPPDWEKKKEKKYCNILISVVKSIIPVLVMKKYLPSHQTEK